MAREARRGKKGSAGNYEKLESRTASTNQRRLPRELTRRQVPTNASSPARKNKSELGGDNKLRQREEAHDGSVPATQVPRLRRERVSTVLTTGDSRVTSILKGTIVGKLRGEKKRTCLWVLD